MQVLATQTALVTGASSGIGQEIAVAMAAAGADILINCYHEEQGARDTLARVQAQGRKGLIFQADVSKEEEVLRMFAAAKEEFGTIDILVNNAGIQKDSPFVEMTLDDWQAVIQTNLTGQFLCAREAAREFLSHGIRSGFMAAGKIIFIGSVHQLIPWAGHVNYAASKGGEAMLMKSIAQELAEHKIRVNSIAPGAVKTDINKDVWSDPRQAEYLRKLIPYQRIGEPGDVAKVAVWLVSEDADYITGTTIYVDGGMTLYPAFTSGG